MCSAHLSPNPVLMDPNESVMRRYQATGLPTMMIVDITGQISFLRTGVVDTATLRREIEKGPQGAESSARGLRVTAENNRPKSRRISICLQGAKRRA